MGILKRSDCVENGPVVSAYVYRGQFIFQFHSDLCAFDEDMDSCSIVTINTVVLDV